MITYLTKMAAIGLAFAGSLWIAPVPDIGHLPLPVHTYTEVGSPTWRISPPQAPISPAIASKPATPVTVAPTPKTCSEWAEYATRYGWPASEVATLTVIMGRESGCQPEAIGDNGASRGLLQIHCPTWVQPSRHWPTGWAAAHGFNVTCDDLHKPNYNLAIGFLIWAGVEGSSGGWWNWTTYTP
jgi:hypothetical protein